VLTLTRKDRAGAEGRPKRRRRMKIVIIGSGMSGLTAGAYLARAGHGVTIFEQFPTPGGVLNVMVGAQKVAKRILKGE